MTTRDKTAGIEHRVRAVTRHVPFRAGATLFNVVLSAIRRDHGTPTWLVSEGTLGHPAMELNVSSPFQRRMFYFPRAYWERLMGLPFGRFVASALREGSVFLDIGANVGFYSLFAAQRVGPSGRVVAFEPDPMTFESLSRSVRRNQFTWVTCANIALSDRTADLPFYTVSDGSAHSLVPEIERRAHRYSGQLRAHAVRLDDWWRDQGAAVPNRIDLVKIDVEGEEVRTVSGMLETLRRFDCPPVWAEVRGPHGSTRAPDTYPSVARELRTLGYAPFKWKRGVLSRVEDGDIRGREDVLFRRP